MKKKKKLKILKQNKKKKLSNRRYIGKAKIFFLLFKKQILESSQISFVEKIGKLTEILSRLTSVLDRSTQKKIFSKNRNAKKKSSIQKALQNFLIKV